MAKTEVNYTKFGAPFGTLYVAYTGIIVRMTSLDVDELAFKRECEELLGVEPRYSRQAPVGLTRAVLAFLDGMEPFSGSLDLSGVSEFRQRALRKAMDIRRGEVRPYRWIAHAIGMPGAARAVGTAMATNPIPILIPCHRVVRADYQIGEYGCGGPEKKREILRYEGVDVDYLESLGRQGVRFQGNRATRVFCMPGCHASRGIDPKDVVLFSSEEQARSGGFQPCEVCRPA